MKKFLFAISFILASFTAVAQEAKVLFDSIPESMLPLLTSVNRADFIDFLESNMKAEVKNKLGGTSEMTDLTTDYIRIRLTDRTTWEMKLLPLNDSTKVICVASTACAPVCDSNIRFYSSEWKEISATPFLTLPIMDDYFHLTDSARLDDYNNYRNKMDMLLAKAELSKDENILTFTFTTPEYIGKKSSDEEKEITDADIFLRKPLVYMWESDPATDAYRFIRKQK